MTELIYDQYNKSDSHKYYEKRFQEFPAELLPKVRECFDNIFMENGEVSDSASFRLGIKKYGLNNWCIQSRFHFSGGMAIRNSLRSFGVTDNLVPSANLDDYYTQLIEWYLGYRVHQSETSNS